MDADSMAEYVINRGNMSNNPSKASVEAINILKIRNASVENMICLKFKICNKKFIF
jgi:hypothetical protein